MSRTILSQAATRAGNAIRAAEFGYRDRRTCRDGDCYVLAGDISFRKRGFAAQRKLGDCERIATRTWLRLEFSVYQGNNRDFFAFGPLLIKPLANGLVDSIVSAVIPCKI
jgi:hypothetical protein